MAPRAGFIVKNAVDVGANLDIAEPDAQDYNLLGNGRYGVITGCDISIPVSTTIGIAAGVYVVNDSLAITTGGQVTLMSAIQSPRFDLIVGDPAGHISGIQGTSSDNPVFPDIPSGYTVFAAVMIRPGVNIAAADVTDKRVMLPTRFTTAITAGSLLHNGDPGNSLAPLFDIDWNGKHQWDGDAFLERSTTQTLKVTTNLDVVGTVHAHDANLDGNLTAAGDVIADNLKTGHGNPTGPGTPADIYRDLDTGAWWVYQQGAWAQISTVPIPPGFVMPGFVTTAPAGWLLVDGTRVSRAASGGLWNAMPSWRVNISGVDYIQLPNATDCFFGWGQPGVKSGNATGTVTLTQANLPPHTHLTSPSGQMNPSGAHSHTASQSAAGAHTHMTGAGQGAHGHTISDPGHLHIPQYDQGGFVCAVWGGHNKLDGLFNDASHTYSVEPLPYTNFGYTNISVDFSGDHVHSTDAQGNHSHGVTVLADGTTHTHVINEMSVGQGTPVDIRPPFMGMYLYVKT